MAAVMIHALKLLGQIFGVVAVITCQTVCLACYVALQALHRRGTARVSVCQSFRRLSMQGACAHLLIEVGRHDCARGLQYRQECEQRNSGPGFPALCASQLHANHHGARLTRISANTPHLRESTASDDRRNVHVPGVSACQRSAPCTFMPTIMVPGLPASALAFAHLCGNRPVQYCIHHVHRQSSCKVKLAVVHLPAS